MSATLVIPDPQTQVVPPGFFELCVPEVAQADWPDLDEYESKLRGWASYIESMKGDALEFEKVLRVVEKRRGELYDSGVTRVLPAEDQPNKMTASRWHKIAEHWDALVWPHLLKAQQIAEVTQAAILRLIESGDTHPKRQNGSTPDTISELSNTHVTESDAPDIVAELERAQREIQEKDAELEALTSDDVAKEYRKKAAEFASLNALYTQQQQTIHELRKDAQYGKDKLRAIRKALGVDTDRAILPAIELLRKSE